MSDLAVALLAAWPLYAAMSLVIVLSRAVVITQSIRKHKGKP